MRASICVAPLQSRIVNLFGRSAADFSHSRRVIVRRVVKTLVVKASSVFGRPGEVLLNTMKTWKLSSRLHGSLKLAAGCGLELDLFGSWFPDPCPVYIFVVPWRPAWGPLAAVAVPLHCGCQILVPKGGGH